MKRSLTSSSGLTFSRSDLLRWLYLGRVTLAAGIFVGALVVWRAVQPEQTLVATVAFLATLGVTGYSFWSTHLLRREPTQNFLYAQVIFDTLLVTAIIHVTGGGESDFAPIYILVISMGALLLPLRGGVLLGGLVSMAYFADIVWGHGETMGPGVGLQIGLFAVVAVVTGWLGDRLRRAGLTLGEVESELRQLRLDTGDILDNVATGVLTVDQGERLVYMNAAAQELLGIDARQWTGAPILPRVEEVAPGLSGLIRRSLIQHRPMPRFKTVARRNGGSLTLGVSTTVLDREEGGAPSVTAIFQDITDQERVELLHRRAERLEAVTELSASLAHEIKNPLASIRSAVEQIIRPGLQDDDREVLEGLVITESERLSRLLSEFIDFSRLRIGKVEPLDLTELVENCITLVRQHPEVRDEVEIRGTGLDGPVLIPGDPDLLHRAIFNLVLNAAQFSPRPGRVEVELLDPSASPVPAELEMARPVRLRVADQGKGIPEGDLPRIFDPFFTTREGGSGLGLSVVHRGVEAHEGAVFVESTEGRGTEFLIYLPSEVSVEDET